jgi:GxxExxY protein
MKTNELTSKIIGLAIQIHRQLGPGLLESVYQTALAYELRNAGISFECEKELPVYYKDVILNIGFRCDFLVDDRVIIECKAVTQLTKLDQAQIINYLKIADKPVGLLINFNELRLKDGLKRFVNNFYENE